MKNYLVVGGTSGIGSSLVEKLGRDSNVWVASRHSTESVAKDRHILWDAISGNPLEGGPDCLDGLAYCPGSIRLRSFPRLTDDDFSEDYQVNCVGAVRAIRASLPALRKSGNASVVLFSTVAVATGMAMHASVAAAKGAVEGLGRALAAELAPHIRVNMIAPSLVDTPMSAVLIADGKRREAAAKRHPLGRIGSAEEVADLAASLMTGALSWTSGEVIRIDGGMSSTRLFT